MKKILIILIPLLAFIAGAVGGDVLHGGKAAKAGAETSNVELGIETGDTSDANTGDDAAAGTNNSQPTDSESASGLDWFKFPNQFFVPIMRNGTPSAVMILSLSIEMPASARSEIETQEHRLRDALLGALMIEANTGAFDGNFTSEPVLRRLRASLLDAAQRAAGSNVKRILIEDIGRQAA